MPPGLDMRPTASSSDRRYFSTCSRRARHAIAHSDCAEGERVRGLSRAGRRRRSRSATHREEGEREHEYARELRVGQHVFEAMPRRAGQDHDLQAAPPGAAVGGAVDEVGEVPRERGKLVSELIGGVVVVVVVVAGRA